MDLSPRCKWISHLDVNCPLAMMYLDLSPWYIYVDPSPWCKWTSHCDENGPLIQDYPLLQRTFAWSLFLGWSLNRGSTVVFSVLSGSAVLFELKSLQKAAESVGSPRRTSLKVVKPVMIHQVGWCTSAALLYLYSQHASIEIHVVDTKIVLC